MRQHTPHWRGCANEGIPDKGIQSRCRIAIGPESDRFFHNDIDKLKLTDFKTEEPDSGRAFAALRVIGSSRLPRMRVGELTHHPRLPVSAE
jgi:hypothetical protein